MKYLTVELPFTKMRFRLTMDQIDTSRASKKYKAKEAQDHVFKFMANMMSDNLLESDKIRLRKDRII